MFGLGQKSQKKHQSASGCAFTPKQIAFCQNKMSDDRMTDAQLNPPQQRLNRFTPFPLLSPPLSSASLGTITPSLHPL